MSFIKTMKVIFSVFFCLLLSACDDGTDSGFPTSACGASDNPCVEIVAFTISPSSKTTIVGFEQQYTAMVFFDDGSQQDVTEQTQWSVDNSAVANISNESGRNGLASTLSAGTTLIGASFRNVNASAQLRVINEVIEQLIIVPVSATLPVGTSQQFSAYLLLTNKQSIEVTEQVTWLMANGNIASINDAAVVTALAQGTTELSATITDKDSNKLIATAQIVVTASVIKEILITPANGTFPVGTTGTYQAVAHYSDGHVVDISKNSTWSMADINIASITASGDFAGDAKALSVGTSQVSASFQGATGTTAVEVTNAVIRSISISPAAAVTPAGTRVVYQAHGIYSDDSIRNITRLAAWSSSIPEIANVQFINALAGVAKTFSPGGTQISAHFDGLVDSVPLTVTAAIAESLHISPQNPVVPLGTEGQFTAIAYYSDGTSYDVTQDSSWQIDDHSIATIDPSGTNAGFAFSMAVGSTPVSASFASLTASTSLTVTNAVLTSLSLTPAQASVPAGGSQAYQLFGVYSDASSKDLTNYASWQSSDSSLATVDSSGLASALKAGKVTISATYQGTITNASLTITQALLTHIEVSPSSVSIAVGHQALFTATAYYSDFSSQDVSGVSTWVSDDSDIVQVGNGGSAGIATAIAVGSTAIKASFNGEQANASVTVTTAVLERVSISPINTSIAAGLTQQYNLTAVFSDGSSNDVTQLASWQSSVNDVATIDVEGLASSSSNGQTTIQASYQGATASATLTVTEAEINKIQITPAIPREPVGTTGQFTAIAYYSDNSSANVTKQVTWSSDDASVVSIVTSGISGGSASANTVGTSKISASLAGISSSTPAFVTSAILESLSLTPSKTEIPAGTTQQYQLFGLFSDGSNKDLTAEASWQTSDVAIASIDTAGLASGLNDGEVTITASYNGSQATASLTVTDAVLSYITLEPATQTIPIGHQVLLKARAYYSDSTSQAINHLATWTTDDDTVAGVDNIVGKAGTVTALSVGDATITVTFEGQSASNITTVTAAVIDSLIIYPTSASIAAGTIQQFQLFAVYSNGSALEVTYVANWQSSDIAVATIDSNGKATSYIAGETTITGNYQGLSTTAALTVTDAVITSIQVSPANISVPQGTQDQFIATAYYSDNSTANITKQATWLSDNTLVVSIITSGSNGGYAEALNVGSAVISASFSDITGNTAQVDVTDAVISSIQITPANVTVPLGTQDQFTAIAYYSDSSSENITEQVTWTSDNNAVVSIVTTGNDAGLAHALAIGEANISAKYAGLSSNIAKVEITASVLMSITIDPIVASVITGATVNYNGTAIYSDGTFKNIPSNSVWKSSNINIASIQPSGITTAVANTHNAGVTNISVSAGNIVSNVAQLTVTDAVLSSIQITPAKISVPIGTQNSFVAIAYYSDNSSADVTSQATWISDNNSVVSIIITGNNAGLAHALITGTANISATLAGVNSNIAVVTVTGKAIDNIQITPNNISTPNGSVVKYTVTAIYDDYSARDVTSDSTLRSLNTSIMTFEDGNFAHTHKVGDVEISAIYNGITSEREFLHVTAATIESIQITPAQAEVAVGTSDTFTAIGYYSDNSSKNITEQVTWQSSNVEVIGIITAGDNSGLAEALSAGMVNITASLKGIKSNIAVITVVGKTLLSIEIVTADDGIIPKGITKFYTAYATYDDESVENITQVASWQSDDTAIATVVIGEVFAVDLGSTNITINFEDKNASQLVTVTNAIATSLAITPSFHEMDIGSRVQYTAIATLSDGSRENVTKDTIRSSSNAIVDVIHDDPLFVTVEGITAGDTVITASFNDQSATANLTILAAILDSIAITPLDETISINSTLAYQAKAYYSDGSELDISHEVSWQSSNTSIATIENVGLAIGISAGTTQISAAFQGELASTALTVSDQCGPDKPVSIFITPNNANISLNTLMQYQLYGIWFDGCSAQLTQNNASNWSSGDSKIVSIGKKDGIALAKKVGSTTINADYQSLTATPVMVTVLGDEEVLSVSIQPAPSAFIAPNSSQNYQCSARTAINGVEQAEKIVTGEASFTSSKASVAAIDNNDGVNQVVVSHSLTGSVSITCHYGGKSSSSNLTVQ